MRHLLLLASALAGTAVPARTDTVCHPPVQVPFAATNWTVNVALPRFDPDLGILVRVQLQLLAQVEVAAQFESLDAAPALVNLTLAGQVQVLRPGGGSVLLSSIPSSVHVDSVTAFDGVIDFRGTSGRTYPPELLMGSDSMTSTAPSDLALFTGPPGNPGTVLTPLDAVGASSAAGPGNLVTIFNTTASASVTVCYVFDLDCNGNGTADAQDIAAGTSLDVNGNGVPDECDYEIDPSLCLGDGSGIACPCGNTSAPGSGEGCLNSLGAGGLLVGSGVARVMADTLVLTASGLPSSTTALFYQGTTTVGGTSGVPFGDGLRCAGGNIVRLGRSIAQSGVASFPPPGSPGIAALGGLGSGLVTRFYQCWYRNAAAFCTSATFNLTNGMRIAWGV